MCGIAGFISFSDKRIDENILRSMRDCMAHRGPDNAGIYISGDRTVGLAHRRLSIIDLSSAGHQPMSNEDGTIWITYNGEIFNYLELKRLLQQLGHSFRSNCDTEVIIHLYEEYGEDSLNYLSGQFAFVIWDSVKRRAFGARDHLGIKPLYYYWDGSTFVFGSELKALLPAVGKGEIDYSAVADFLVLQYVPSPKTIYRHIRKLEAGTCLLLDNGELRTKRYWTPQPEHTYDLSEEIIAEQIDELLHNSVKQQLISDVPLGVFLSGGLDSSTITYYMSATTGTTVKAYSVGFEEREYSELDYATIAANYIPNVEHHKLILKASTAFDLIQDLIQTLDEPFADQAIIPTYLMSRYARESVTVCLSGEGSDEIFGGYDRYKSAIRTVKLLGELTRVNPELYQYLRDGIALKYDEYISSLCSFRPGELLLLLHRDVRGFDDYVTTKFREFYEKMAVTDDLEKVQMFDVSTYLSDNLLFKVDRASMLASLEVRVPFLEPRLVNFCIGLPFHIKYRSNLQKYILKKLMKDRIPNEVIFRKKMGFSVPIFVWFQQSFYEYLRETLLSKKAKERNIFKPRYVESLLDPQRITTDRHNSLKLWCLLVLEEWFRRYHD